MNEPDPPYDAAIVGAGVVGLAVFRALVLAGARTVLIERDADILSGASKANSAILHTGFDSTPGTLEASCVRAGYAGYAAIHARLNLPLVRTGAIVVAWSDAEHAQLPAIVRKARENGVEDVVALDADEVRGREPNLAPDLKGGVWVPGESVIDPWSAPLAYGLQALANGGRFLPNAEVLGGNFDEKLWFLRTGAGEVRARLVINCAGTFGDIVEAIARPSPFTIRPRRGQFVVFDKPAHDLVGSIILPVPTERTKGIVVTRTVFGNLLVGPTAEEVEDRRVARTEAAALDGLVAAGRRFVPALAHEAITTAYAGLRPATQFKDYQIEGVPERQWITVAGIRSTGLTGALGIAEHVLGLVEAQLGPLKPLAEPIWPSVPNISEGARRAVDAGCRGSIVCHCERVTGEEIDRAFDGPLPARTLGGLRRRTRCMNGVCQGFYCTRRVMERAARHLPNLVETLGLAGAS